MVTRDNKYLSGVYVIYFPRAYLEGSLFIVKRDHETLKHLLDGTAAMDCLHADDSVLHSFTLVPLFT